jgi:hypothetical protein
MRASKLPVATDKTCTLRCARGKQINNFGETLIFNGSTLRHNLAPTWGGGAVNAMGNTTVDDSDLSYNGSPAGWGGAMDVNGPVTVRRSTFFGNVCPAGKGGAVYMGHGTAAAPTLTVTDCVISGNAAQSGAFYADTGVTTLISGSTWSNNSVSINGAALFSVDRAVHVSSSSFVAGSAPNGIGGALFVGDAQHVLTDVLFDGNSAYQSAGALFTLGGNLQLSGCTFSRNTVAGLFSRAGALSIEAQSGGAASFSNCTFSANQAYTPVLSQDFLASAFSVSYARADVSTGLTASADVTFGQGKGGALFVASALGAPPLALALTDCTFSANSAMYGGAVSVPGSGQVSLSFARTSFAGNAASGDGGALYVGSASATALDACTLAGNSAARDGGAIFAHATSAVAVTNSTLSANSAVGLGGAVVAADAAAATLSGGAVTGNRAFGGGAFYVANGPAGAAPSLAVQSDVTSNFAQAGGAWLQDAATTVPPGCAAGGSCAVANNSAWLGPTYATLPTRIGVDTPHRVRSAAGSAAQLLLYDDFDQVATSWDLLAQASLASSDALSGALDATYTNGSASFPLLMLRGPELATFTLSFSVSALSLGALNGASVDVAVAIQFCNVSDDGVTPLPMQLDPAALRCICNPGTFAALSADGQSTTCVACPSGTVAPDKGATACVACPANNYATSETECAECPPAASAPPGSAALSDCACAYGFYASYDDPQRSFFSCVACPDGALCPGPVTPLALEGYWRLPDDDTHFYPCEEGHCEAQTVDDVGAEDNCREGHRGVTCGVCVEGYTKMGNLCSPCKPHAAFAMWPAPSRDGFIFACVFAGVAASAAFMLAPVTADLWAPTVQHLQRRLAGRSGADGADAHASAAPAAAVVDADADVDVDVDMEVDAEEAAPEAAAKHVGAHTAGHHDEHHEGVLGRLILLLAHAVVPLRMSIENIQIVSAFQDTCVGDPWRVLVHMERVGAHQTDVCAPACSCVVSLLAACMSPGRTFSRRSCHGCTF